MTTTTGELDLEYFQKIGFDKRVCSKCNRYYWTSDADRNTCGDPPCDSYSFIGNSPMGTKYNADEIRSMFLGFFEKSHSIVKPYPVVPRWRDDVLLVNASIYNFQPHVTSGRVSPPGNPLAMSQPSIRMVDTDLVGETGRHLTSFEMMCHDSFNYESKFVYWKEETVEYCHRFLTEKLGVEPGLITYKEKPWSGGGNGGNAFEVFIRGLEVATLVFMDMQESKEGQYEIDGKMYAKMDMKIVDTGYGLERLVWLSQGTPTVYQAVIPYAIDHIIGNSAVSGWNPDNLATLSRVAAEFDPFDREKVLEKTRNAMISEGHPELAEHLDQAFDTARSVYILADHTKTLMILFSDYVIPSNVKVGYIARLLIRRALRAKNDCGYTGSLYDLIELHHRQMKEVVTNFPSEFIREALMEEETRYSELEKKAENTVLRAYDKKKGLSPEDLVTLYDSYGIVPETAAHIVEQKRHDSIAIPGDFNSLITSFHEQPARKPPVRKSYPDIFTRPLYYDDTSIMEFNAIVLHSEDNTIIPNQTAFYPEGGGQPTDLGAFTYRGKSISMLGAEKHGRSVVHRLESPIPKNSRIIGHVDEFRRSRLMVHHSATHLLLGVLREVLGEHVWQSGVQKGVEHSRIDITHFRKPDETQIREIEARCLKYIRENRSITVRNIEWNKALSKYGFRLFEGGVPDGKNIRVVEIQGVDAEGCGGTHVKSTGELGFIKILKVEAIQEGIQRFTFAAGEAALDYIQKLFSVEQILENELSVSSDKVGESFMRLLNENIELKKERDRKIKETVDRTISAAVELKEGGFEAYYAEGSFDDIEMKALVSALFSLRKDLFILNNRRGAGSEVRFIASKVDAVDVCRCFSQKLESSPEGTARHSWFTTAVQLDVSLIRKLLHDCKPRGS